MTVVKSYYNVFLIILGTLTQAYLYIYVHAGLHAHIIQCRYVNHYTDINILCVY